MTFNLRHLVPAAVLATAFSSAFAATPISLGTNPDSAPIVGTGLSTTPVPWSYSFTLDSLTDLSNLTLSLRSTDPVDYSISLTGPTSTTIAIAGSTNIPATYSFNSLADGAYVLSIIGTPSSSYSAAYGGSLSAVAAVPEPESLALTLAGLGVAGTLLRRRKIA
ncbi:MAG TPA: FxDxF family PEP-CTERM protein [Candidatus Aquabacterium excrementipullorum]|nr:FxDxF family PEP-CTERM protein [Candidatus Aquabacterium excrementipullorum]